MARGHSTYVFRAKDGTALYVGVTDKLRNRLGRHRRTPWFSHAATIDVERWPTREAAEDREHELIVELSPLHNRSLGTPAAVARAAA